MKYESFTNHVLDIQIFTLYVLNIFLITYICILKEMNKNILNMYKTICVVQKEINKVDKMTYLKINYSRQ